MKKKEFLQDPSKTNILVVEDEVIITNNIIMILTSLRYKVCGSAATGEEAVEKADALRPDLVLMDVVLRGRMDGTEAAAQIQKKFNIPVVYLTSYVDEKSLDRTSSTLPYGFISKPVSSKDLDIAIRMALIRYGIEKQLKESEKRYRILTGKVRKLSAHFESVRENERTRVAREIHDELGQALTALKMDLSWLCKKMPDRQELMRGKIEEMTELTDQIIQTVKKISSDLRPGLLDDLGLIAAIEWQIQNFQEKTGISCDVQIDQEEIDLERDISTALFRIFQETLTNIARHAKATKVNVCLELKDGELEMIVRDNGIGINQEQIDNPESFGLLGIKERVGFFKGNVDINGIPDSGTVIRVKLPIDPAKVRQK
jgi:signal transduction histidine kinase